jgi:hypothetical protein
MLDANVPESSRRKPNCTNFPQAKGSSFCHEDVRIEKPFSFVI